MRLIEADENLTSTSNALVGRISTIAVIEPFYSPVTPFHLLTGVILL